MGFKFIESWASRDLKKWDSGSCISIDTSLPGITGYACKSPTDIIKLLTSRADYYGMFRVRAASGLGYIYFLNGTTVLGRLTMNSGQSFKFERGGTTIIGSSTRLFASGITYLIEIYYLPSTTSGTLTVKIDGITEITLTGVQTANNDLNIDNIRITSSGTIYFGEIILRDDTWIGNKRVQGIFPNAADTGEWSGYGSATNYENVDDAPSDDDTSYNYTDTADKVDLFDLGALTGAPTSIDAVQVSALAKQYGAASVQNLALLLKSGTTLSASSDIAVLQDNYKVLSNIWTINPDTSSAFTPSEITSLKAGYKSRT
jgi:hypothetical protein